MGQKTSKHNSVGGANEDPPLTINHPRLKNIRVISPPSEQEDGIIQVSIPLPNENEFNKWDKTVRSLEKDENTFLPLSQKFEKTQFCGSGGIATVQYKYYPYLLSDEVVNRHNIEGKFFEEVELWYLIYSIIQAAASFHAKGQKVGDIQPKNVFISPEGQVKVATQHTWPGEQTNYFKTIFEKQTTYLSPEELKDIGYGKLDQSQGFSINESFSVGLTCLDAAILSDSSKLYEANNKFNYSHLEQQLSSLERNRTYSEPLTLIIKGLCQVQTDKRCSCRELTQWLARYEEDIVELREFAVQELPEKLRNLRSGGGTDSRMRQTAPQPQPQPAPIPQQHMTYVGPPPGQGNNVVIRQQNPQYFQRPVPAQSMPTYSQQKTYAPGQPQVQMVQSYYNEQPVSTQMSNSNQYPSVMTFQKEQRSTIAQNGQSNSQVGRGNINLAQIDEQLQKSRKLFPS